MRRMHVLEIGPGPGYFSTHVAKALKHGKLTLIDIQHEMLDFAARRLKKRGLNNVEYILTDGMTLDASDKHFDRISMVTVIGEVDNKNSHLKEIHRILKDDGILSISELAGDPDKLSVDEIKTLVSAHEFETAVELFGNRFNYTINIKKTAKSSQAT